MANGPTIDQLSREELIVIVREQAQRIAALDKLIEQLKRKKSRPASPFSKEKPVLNPKRPGRRKGEGPFNRRQAPLGEPDVTVEAKAPSCCPDCGGSLEQTGVEQATTVDLPKLPTPRITAYGVAGCRCVNGGKKVGAPRRAWLPISSVRPPIGLVRR